MLVFFFYYPIFFKVFCYINFILFINSEITYRNYKSIKFMEETNTTTADIPDEFLTQLSSFINDNDIK